MAGRLEKTTSFVNTQVVVGQQCVRYETTTPEPPPPLPDQPPPPVKPPKPPGMRGFGGGGGSCPPMKLVTWTEDDVKYGQYQVSIPTGYSGISVPAGCPTASTVFKI